MSKFYYAVSTNGAGTEGLFTDFSAALDYLDRNGFCVGDPLPSLIITRRPIKNSNGLFLGWLTLVPVMA